MMFVERCVVWQESQQSLPCRLDKNRVQSRTGRADAVSDAARQGTALAELPPIGSSRPGY